MVSFITMGGSSPPCWEGHAFPFFYPILRFLPIPSSSSTGADFSFFFSGSKSVPSVPLFLPSPLVSLSCREAAPQILVEGLGNPSRKCIFVCLHPDRADVFELKRVICRKSPILTYPICIWRLRCR